MATTYYVSKHGGASDLNGGLNNTTDAWATIEFAVQQLVAGDTLVIGGGVYEEDIAPGGSGGIGWTTGTAAMPILVLAEGHVDTAVYGVVSGTANVVIRPTGTKDVISFNTLDVGYWRFKGLVLDGINQTNDSVQCVALLRDANNIEFRNCEIRNGGFGGVTLSYANAVSTTDRNNIFRWNKIHGNGRFTTAADGHGIYCLTRGNLFEHNDIFNNRNGAIQIRSDVDAAGRGRNNTVRRNRLHGNQTDWTGTQAGVFLHTYARDNFVYRNLIYDMKDMGIQLSSTLGSSNNTLYLNTIWNCGVKGIELTNSAVATTDIRGNLIWDCPTAIDDNGTGTTLVENYTTPDPLFVDEGSADLHLQSGSSARNTVTALGSPYDVDLDGVTVTGTPWDAGAYEFATPQAPTVTGPNPVVRTVSVGAVLGSGFVLTDPSDPDDTPYDLTVVVTAGTLTPPV